jgi:integrase
MKGSIYTTQKCYECGKNLRYVEGNGILQCKEHPQYIWTKDCRVKFDQEHIKRFPTVLEAERHLTYLRSQTDHGAYDARDWRADQPLSFRSQREKFVLSKKKDGITPKQLRHITYVLEKAGEKWDPMSIKDIAEGEIEDFLDEDHGVGNKTLSNYKTVLHDFWTWVVRREKRKSGIEMPEFPEVKFELGMKKIVSMDDQADIMKELKRITLNENPRIWLGVWLMSWYPKVRPGEMLSLREGHINLSDKWMVFPHPKEKNKPKFINLLPEHIEVIQEIQDMTPTALPEMFFFRHLKTKSGVKAGTPFGPKYFNIWWKKACKNLGISGVSVYPGVKHSTVTALGQVLSPERIQHDVTGHVSDAFKRYFLPDKERAVTATRQINKIRKEKSATIIKLRKKKG